MRAAVIFNPHAGAGVTTLGEALAVLRKAGWPVEVLATSSPGEATRLARDAAGRGVEAVLAAGGDGTVNEVANGLYGSEAALGVLPIGTANVWAKEMGLKPGDLVHAARQQLQAHKRWVDVGQVSGPTIKPRIFLLWSGVGFDAHITEEIERIPLYKRRLGALLFWVVGAQAAFAFRGRPAILFLDGEKMRGRFMLILACNAQLYGGVVRIAPGARVDDGQLDLAAFHGTGAVRTGWHLVRVLFGQHIYAPDVIYHRASVIEIRVKHMPVHVDAEPVGETPVTIRTIPHGLCALIPPGANVTLFEGGVNGESTRGNPAV